MVDLHQSLALALPWLTSFAALTLPGILKNDRLNPAWNGILAGLAVILFAFLTALSGGKLTGNLWQDTGILAGLFSAALAGPLKPLDSFLQSAIRIPGLHPAPAAPSLLQSAYPAGRATNAYTPPQLTKRATLPQFQQPPAPPQTPDQGG